MNASTVPLCLSRSCDRPLWILVVEDDPVLRDLVRTILTEETSYQVIAASSGQRALQQVASQRARGNLPALLLLDYQIGPDITGIDVYDQLQLSPGCEAIPTIFMSANLPREHLRARGLKSLSKPFEVDDLLRVVEEVLEGHRIRR